MLEPPCVLVDTDLPVSLSGWLKKKCFVYSVVDDTNVNTRVQVAVDHTRGIIFMHCSIYVIFVSLRVVYYNNRKWKMMYFTSSSGNMQTVFHVQFLSFFSSTSFLM